MEVVSLKLKDEVMSSLVEKYHLLEKGCLAVVTLLKNKIQSGSVKIKHFTEKMLQHRHSLPKQSVTSLQRTYWEDKDR